MAIVVRLDVMLALRKARSKDVAAFVGITETNLSLLKAGRVKGVRFETLDAICRYLKCQPGEILIWEEDEAAGATEQRAEAAKGGPLEIASGAPDRDSLPVAP
jgi:putative transcriptional regulator